MESHGKEICFRKIKRQKDEKFEKKYQTSRKQALISVKIKTSSYFMHMLLKDCFDTTVRTNA